LDNHVEEDDEGTAQNDSRTVYQTAKKITITSNTIDFSEDELRKAVTPLKRIKSPGMDGISVGLKAGDESVIKSLHILCDKIWNDGEIPLY